MSLDVQVTLGWPALTTSSEFAARMQTPWLSIEPLLPERGTSAALLTTCCKVGWLNGSL